MRASVRWSLLAFICAGVAISAVRDSLASLPPRLAVSSPISGTPVALSRDAAPSAATPDGAGGAILTSLVTLNQEQFAFIQRLDALGQPRWGDNGIRLSQSYTPAAYSLPDGAGGVIVSWLEYRSGGQNFVAQHFDAEGAPLWASAGSLCTNSASSKNAAAMVSDGVGGFYLVWGEMITGTSDVFAQHVDADGQPLWPAGGVALCIAPNEQTPKTAVDDGVGGLIVAWEDMRGATRDIYAQRIDDTGAPLWAVNGVPVCTAVGAQSAPIAVSDGAQGALIGWTDQRTGVSEIYVQRMLWDGSPVAVANGRAPYLTSENHYYVCMVPDGSGGAILSWTVYRSGYADVYAQRVNSVCNRVWAQDGVPICTAPNSAYDVSAVPDGAGGAVIAWSDTRAGDYDVYAQRIGSASQLLWTIDGVAVSTAPGSQNAFPVMADGTGGFIVSWLDRRAQGTDPNRGDNDVYAQRITNLGALSWPGSGQPVHVDPGVERLPVMVADGAGGVITAWQDKKDGDYDIQVRRSDGFNHSLYGTVTVCGSPWSQVEPAITGDGAGGAIIAWADRRSGDWDIYAQRVLANGSIAPGWPANGVLLCGELRGQFSVAITTDGAGGAIVAWTDPRFSLWDVYAQRVSASGSPLWTPGGVAVSAASNSQAWPSIISDEQGGAFVTWVDNRSGSYDQIYGQHLTSAGAPLWTVNGVPLQTAPALTGFTRMCLDANGGFLATWYQYNPANSASERRAQRINIAGARVWGTDGLLLNLPGSYAGDGGDLVPDGHGGAIIAFPGQGPTGSDVLLQRVDSLGVNQWAAGGVAVDGPSNSPRHPLLAQGPSGSVFVSWVNWLWGSNYDIYATRVSASGSALWAPGGIGVVLREDRQDDQVMATDAQGGVYVAWRDHRNLVSDFVLLGHLDSLGVATPNWTVADAPPVKPSSIALRVGPNPARGSQSFEVTLESPGALRVEVFDISGRRVRLLHDRQTEAGPTVMTWDGSGENGAECAPGVYLVQVRLPQSQLLRRIVRLP